MISQETEGFVEVEVSESHAVVCRMDQMQRTSQDAGSVIKAKCAGHDGAGNG